MRKIPLEKFPIVAPCENICLRLDGNNFSKFSKKYFQEPFDSRFTDAMIYTTKCLMERFSCSFGYTISDEVLLFIPKCQNSVHPHGGRLEKLISLTASTASSSFNHFLNLNYDKKHFFHQTFDSRGFGFVEEKIPLQMIRHCQQINGYRNVVNKISKFYFGQERIRNLKRPELILKLRNIGVPIDPILGGYIHNDPHISETWKTEKNIFIPSPQITYGVFVKKSERRKVNTMNVEVIKPTSAIHTFETKSFHWNYNYKETFVLVNDKFWETSPNIS
jgi:tRNA(His) 5'-end guanylyltransferase